MIRIKFYYILVYGRKYIGENNHLKIINIISFFPFLSIKHKNQPRISR